MVVKGLQALNFSQHFNLGHLASHLTLGNQFDLHHFHHPLRYLQIPR